MKTRLLTIALAVMGSYHLSAVEIDVTPETFVDTYNATVDGDVLLLATGDYTTRLQFPSGKTITLKAAQGETPLFKADIQSSGEVTDGGLIFDGVDIDRESGNYLLDVTLKNIKLIAFRNLTVKNIGRCLIRAQKVDDVNTIDKIEVENCIITNCGTNRYNLIYTQHGVEEVTVKNSTLYNYTDGESFFCVYAPNPDNVMNFLFENNTVYKWGKDSTRALAKIEGNYNAASTYTFFNNIVNVPGVVDTEPMIVDATEGTIVGENNLIVNYGGYNGGTQKINDLTLEGLGLSSIGFADPENGNFTIANSSPLATAGVNGAPVGDPRWIEGGSSIGNTSADPEFVDVYSIEGYILRKNVANENALSGLAKGIYIVNGKKVAL